MNLRVVTTMTAHRARSKRRPRMFLRVLEGASQALPFQPSVSLRWDIRVGIDAGIYQCDDHHVVVGRHSKMKGDDTTLASRRRHFVHLELTNTPSIAPLENTIWNAEWRNKPT